MRKLLILAAAAAVTAVPALAADPSPRPQALEPLFQCRGLADVAARAACYDSALDSLAAATARRDVVVVNREEVQKTRKSLFGLSLPNLGVFGDKDAADEVKEVEGKLARASQTPYGKWIFTLADGAVWAQTDTRKFIVDPRPGHAIRIRRAALGSFVANVNEETAVRVQRLR